MMLHLKFVVAFSSAVVLISGCSCDLSGILCQLECHARDKGLKRLQQSHGYPWINSCSAIAHGCSASGGIKHALLHATFVIALIFAGVAILRCAGRGKYSCSKQRAEYQ